jgi:ribokinase
LVKGSCVVVKRGAKGAIAIQDNEVFTDSGFRVKALDTTGAGDSFDAGFLSAYLMKQPLSDVYDSATPAAHCPPSASEGQRGSPTQAELQEF